MPVGFVNQDANADPFVDGVVVEEVNASDRGGCWQDVNHQPHLLVGDQVAIAQEKLLDLETGGGGVGLADPPYSSVVFPTVDQVGIFWFGDAK